jgi:dienelactone hydrolase
MAIDAYRAVRRLTLAALAALSPGLALAAAEEERIEIRSLDGTTLAARLFKPEGQGPFAAVVMLHGCGGMFTKSGKLNAREAAWAGILAGQGYVVVLPDSFGSRGHGSLCRSQTRPVRADRDRPYDAYGALKWLQVQPYVKPDRIALAGWSNGAMTLLWTLKDDAKARPMDLAHDFVAGVGFYPGCADVGKTDYRPMVPVLLQVGLDDNWTPPKPCQDLVEAANGRGARMEIDAYEGAVHGFDHPNSTPRTVQTRSSSSPTGLREVRVGTHPEARAKAIERATAYLRRALSQ